jgi:hemerythrin HHE cation binding domain-containing protein
MQQREVGEAYEASTSALEAAKGQRHSLRRAIAGLEEALSARGDGTDDLAGRLAGALERLHEVFAVHVEVTEAPGGLYGEILENAPRMANRVNRFRREHTEIADGIRRCLAEAKAAAGDAAAPPALRDHAVRLLADLVRHRKRGLDMVYEAYHVDIGGES